MRLLMILFACFFSAIEPVSASVSWDAVSAVLGSKLSGYVESSMVWLGVLIGVLSLLQKLPIKAMREHRDDLSKAEQLLQKIVRWGPTVGESLVKEKKKE